MESFQVRNLDRGHITVFGEVDDEKVQAVVEQLLYLEARASVREITIWINSTGGLLQPAFGLADVMELLSTPVRTIGLGTVESAATVILTSGTRGRRLLTRSSSIMIHEYSWSNSGSVTEMRGRMSEIRNTAAKQVEHLAKVCQKPPAEVRKLLKHEETWLRPEDAIAWGMVDGVLDVNPAKATPRARRKPRVAAAKKKRAAKSRGKTRKR